MGKKKKNDIVGKIPKGVWLLISLAVALILWTLLSFGKVPAGFSQTLSLLPNPSER